MARTGRPPKLTEAAAKAVLGGIAVEMSISSAAYLANVVPTTVTNWLKRGKIQRRGKYRDFLEQYKRAAAAAEARDLRTIDDYVRGIPVTKTTTRTYTDPKTKRVVTETTEETHTERSWQAAMTRRERRDPKRWGRRLHSEITGKDGKDLNLAAGNVVFMLPPKEGQDEQAMTPAEAARMAALFSGSTQAPHGSNGGNGNGNGGKPGSNGNGDGANQGG